MCVQHYQNGILPGGVDTVLPPEWTFNAPLTDSLAATGRGDNTPTFVRASVATYKNMLDELVAVASGVPRFAPEGLLVEGVRTNILKYSEALETNLPWQRLAASVLANNTASPYVGAPVIAETVLEQASNNYHNIWQDYTGTSDTIESFSVFAKPAGRSWFNIQWWEGNASGSDGWIEQFYNVSTGTLGIGRVSNGTVSIVSASIEPYVGGWYRCTLVVQSTTNTSRHFGFGPSPSDGVATYLGTAEVLGTHFIGPQGELNVAFVSSYIPTVAATVTRQQDKLTYPSDGAPLGDGTIIAEFTKYHVQSETAYIVATVDGSQRQGVELRVTPTNRMATRVWEAGPGWEADITSAGDAYTANTPFIVRGFFLTNFVTMWVNETRYGTDFVATMPTSRNRISIGMGGADESPLWGWVKNVTMYDNPRAL